MSTNAQTIDFDNAANWTTPGPAAITSYATYHLYSDGTWNFTGGPALRNTSGLQDGFAGALGTYSWRLQNVASVNWTGTYQGSSSITQFGFSVRRWDGSPSPAFDVTYSTDGGTTYSAVLATIDNTYLGNTSDWTVFSYTVPSPAAVAPGNFIVRVVSTGTTERIMIDSFTYTTGAGSGCGITLGAETASCNTVTAGPGDTYDLSIPYTGMDAGTSVVNNSGSGTIGGDDPALVAGGTIVISGISEADDYNVTFTTPCDLLVVSGTAPVCEPPPALVINEVLADPASGADPNGDGIPDTGDDEFVEIVNNGATDIDMSGFTLSDAVGVRHTFPPGSIVTAGCAIVVFGGGTPTGAFGGATVQTASSGLLGMNNGGDDVIIADASSTLVVSVTYVGPTDQSTTRDPDITGAFVAHSGATGSIGDYSPGTKVDGSTFSGCTPPACGITPGVESTSCNSLMAGPGDTYDLSIPYVGVQAGITVINNSGSGTVGGDDPATVTNGTIVISSISDADAYSVTFSAPCNSFTVADAAPICEPLPPLVINEILADPDATTGDANGDGVVNTTQDEFVEIVNNGAVALDISDYTISDAFTVRHTFPIGTVIPANCAIIVFGGGIPSGTFGGTLVQVASSGSLGLNNGGDDVTLADAASTLVTSITYGSEGGANQSLVRSPDITGTDPLIQITTAPDYSLAGFTPGVTTAQSNFSGCTAPVGGLTLIDSHCGKMDLLPGGQIISKTDAMVTAQYGVGNNSDDGYQFWIMDPASSYNRRAFISHANPMTGVPLSSSAASHLRYSNLITNPVPLNTLLEVRVRPRVNGLYEAFGPVCNIMILSAPVACPTTKLIDDMNNQFFSCGIGGVVLNGSDKIVAKPIAGANKYKFEFELSTESYLRRITSNSYALVLNTWTTNPLSYGKTYDVRVQASFDGGATYCPYGDVCTISTAAAPPAFSASLRNGIADNIEFGLWPNPLSGSQLHMSIPAEGAVVLALYSMQGSLMMSQEMDLNGQQNDVLVELPGGLASGIYLMQVQGNNATYSKRLVIE